ncbi:MAG TPA: FAD-dependent oxidoreductase [Bauldia sp.]|nr:FAD-dependent oxidoreductase [Bauldia sp.]
MDIAVVGGGVFGTMIAIDLAEAGHTVTLLERRHGLLQGASQHANRLHLGFHYPRNSATARHCLLGYERFRTEFGEAVLPGVANAYFIASEGSLVSPDRFLAFCDSHGLPYREIDPAKYRSGMSNVDLGVLTEEVMYDPSILRGLLMARLDRAGVDVCLGATVDHIERTANGGFAITIPGGPESRFDAIVNCSYANLNRLSSKLGYDTEPRQYEYVATAVIELPDKDTPSVTVLDGPFFGLLPLNSDGDILFYHVLLSVIARQDTRFVDQAWLDPDSAPFASVDKRAWFRAMIEAATHYMPELKNVRVKGFREGARMVLANAEDTDARPSIVARPEPGYVEVFSGKIVHSMWVGGEVERLLGVN